jgi:hypothetical protein
MPATNWMTPWLTSLGLQETQEPLSGDVSQWFRIFSPTISVNGAGEPALEGSIVRDVATYGAQLGPLTEIVLALAAGTPPSADAVTELQDIQRRVDAKKREYRTGAVARARSALDKLKETDPSSLASLLKDFTA